MLLRGIKPPQLGSVRDRIMTEMFIREQVLDDDKFMTLATIVTALTATRKETLGVVNRILEDWRESGYFNRWSVDKKQKDTDKRLSDLDLLQQVNKLGSK